MDDEEKRAEQLRWLAANPIVNKDMPVGKDTRAHSNPVSPASKGRLPHKKEAKKRQSESPLDGELDLHGYTLEEALARTDLFLSDAAAAGWQEIRLIHGHSRRSPLTIRKELHRALAGRFRNRVKAYTQEPGNPGATWVRLRHKN